MTTRRGIDRRSFLFGSTAVSALGIPGTPYSALAERCTPPPAGHWRWAGYADAVVIDCLASPGYFNYPIEVPLTESMIRNALESGITAVNLTVSKPDFDQTIASIARWLRDIARFSNALRQIRTVDDINRAKDARQFGIVLGFQDTTPLEGDLDKLIMFADFGVRIVQLTYNVRNLVGDGCLEPSNGGLSRFGLSVIEAMNERGLLIDLSHCGQKTTAEGISASGKPVSITHSGCNAIAAHPRNKDDAELRALADRGGVVGIYLMPFLTPGRPATTRDVIAHIEHAIQICGEDHVGIGSDLSTTPIDGSDEYWHRHRAFVKERIEQGIAAPAEDPDILFTVEEFNRETRMDMIACELSSRGHSDARIEKIIGGNFRRLFDEVWNTSYQ